MLIIGSGIIGLSIGVAILQSHPKIRVRILEKEQSLGVHASGRNSGVLHSGFYYSPESLKAQFCRNGNLELRALCKQHKIPVLNSGKIVVSRNATEDALLDNLLVRGIQNGVHLELLDKEELQKYEPLASTHQRFIWSPQTAVSDPIRVIEALRLEFLSQGGIITFSETVQLQKSEGEFFVPSWPARFIINAAGAQADRLARKAGLAHDLAMIPFMGVYRAIKSAKLPIRTLVYPVPNPVNPFLGVHLTLTVDNYVKVGPTAIPILGREQYSLFDGCSAVDILDSIRASISIIAGKEHDFSQLVRDELPKLLEKNLIAGASSLIPSLVGIRGWQKKRPGIRSQLVNMKTGKLEQDFIVESTNNSIHVLNAVSPGWTSALPFGRWIVETFLSRLL